MSEFVYGWKRKAGCVTLVIALLPFWLWILDYLHADPSMEALNLFTGGRLAWDIPEERPKYELGFGLSGTWFGKIQTDVVGMTGIFVISNSDWQAFTLLTLLSAYLILRPGKRASIPPTTS